MSLFSNVLKDVEYQILDDYFEMLISNEACRLDLISRRLIINLFVII
jgi:hypothetical protein